VNLYLLLSVISLLCLGLQFEPLQSGMAWTSAGIQHGQWWRILTGNFTHTNFAHLAMNLAGLWVISYIFRPATRQLMTALLFIGMVVGVSNLFSEMTSYVGLSGVLHGVFACFALSEALNGRRSSWLLVLGVMAKVVWEHTVGPSEETSALIGARVAIEAHLAGMLGGIALALATYILSRSPQKNA